MLKRFMVLSLGIALCLATVGCGSKSSMPDNPTPPPEKPPAQQDQAVPPPPP